MSTEVNSRATLFEAGPSFRLTSRPRIQLKCNDARESLLATQDSSRGIPVSPAQVLSVQVRDMKALGLSRPSDSLGKFDCVQTSWYKQKSAGGRKWKPNLTHLRR